MCQNFKAWFRWVVAHLPRHKIHDIKSNLAGYHHLEGLWDWSTYNRFRGMITLSRNYVTPCIITFSRNMNCWNLEQSLDVLIIVS